VTDLANAQAEVRFIYRPASIGQIHGGGVDIATTILALRSETPGRVGRQPAR